MRKPNCIICGGVDGVKMLLDVRQFGLIQLCSRCRKKLEELGMPKEEAKGVFGIKGANLITDVTKGIQHLHEAKELLKQAFEEVCQAGPKAAEPLQGVKVRLVDAKLHEDAIHRGPAQLIPAMRNAIYGAMTVSYTHLTLPTTERV